MKNLPEVLLISVEINGEKAFEGCIVWLRRMNPFSHNSTGISWRIGDGMAQFMTRNSSSPQGEEILKTCDV